MTKTLHILYVIIAAVMTATTIGCTHNNGDIGKIFGQWQLRSVEAVTPGTEPVMPEGEMYWAFQSSTIRVSLVSDKHDVSESYGNFRIEDQTLFLDFPDTAYPQLIPGADRQSRWQIVKFTSKELILLFTSDDGAESEWKFHKW